MEKDISIIWLAGIYDPVKQYGILLHAGTEEQVLVTYNSMLNGARSSGLNTHCLKIMSPAEWHAIANKKNIAPGIFIEQLLDGSLGFNELF